MNTTTTELESEIVASVFGAYLRQPEQMLTRADRWRLATLNREEYREEAMKQIKAALASL